DCRLGHEATPPHPYDPSDGSSPVPHVPSLPPHLDATELVKCVRAAPVIAVVVAFASQSVDGGSEPLMRTSSHFWIAFSRSMTYLADALVIARAHGESTAYAEDASTTTSTGTTRSRFMIHR